jgi:DNA polymerase kappa
MEALSQEYENANVPSNQQAFAEENENEKEETWDCPVCSRSQSADERAFNEHIDACLSRKTIADVVKEQKQETSVPSSGDASTTTPRMKSQLTTGTKKKRGRPRTNTNDDVHRNVKRQAFFS